MLEEKILWIDSALKNSGTNNNFNYAIGNILEKNFKKLSVEMIDCVVNKNYGVVDDVADYAEFPVPFDTRCIKIFIDLGVSNNCYYRFGSNMLMGIIGNDLLSIQYPNDGTNAISLINISSKTCSKLKDNNIKYNLNNAPSGFIDIHVYSDANIILVDKNGNAPSSVIICLKFTYEIF